MTGSNRLDERMVKGLIAMLNSFKSDNPQTIDNEITTIKFYRLVMFNCTFHLFKHESDTKYLFVDLVTAFVKYLKRLMVKYNSDVDYNNIDVLFNLCLNVFIALAEPKNYAMQFKNVLKLEKYGFDLAEIKYLNDNLDNYMQEVRAAIEVNLQLYN